MKMESLGFALIFLLFVFHPHYFREARKRKDFISQSQNISGACKKDMGHRSCWADLCRMCKGSWTEGFGFHTHVCPAPCFLWAYCHVLHDPLWSLKIYDLSHRKYKGLLLSLGLDTQKFTWIMKNPCVKLMWVCHSNFILVRWFI